MTLPCWKPGLLAVFSLTLLTSCALNESKKAFSYFRESKKESESFEAAQPVAVAHRLVEEGAQRCYAARATGGMAMVSGIPVVTPGADMTVLSEPFHSPAGEGMAIRVGAGNSFNYVPMFQVDLSPLRDGAQVTMYYEFRGGRADGRFRRDVEAWISGDTAHCSKSKR